MMIVSLLFCFALVSLPFSLFLLQYVQATGSEEALIAERKKLRENDGVSL